MAEPKVVGGLHCFDVLAQLSDYVDGALSPQEKAKVEAHLKECMACTEFGGQFGAVLEAARALSK